jgi:hypothetical protein
VPFNHLAALSVQRFNHLASSMFNMLNAAKQRLNTEQREVIEPRKAGIERRHGQSTGNQLFDL